MISMKAWPDSKYRWGFTARGFKLEEMGASQKSMIYCIGHLGYLALILAFSSFVSADESMSKGTPLNVPPTQESQAHPLKKQASTHLKNLFQAQKYQEIISETEMTSDQLNTEDLLILVQAFKELKRYDEVIRILTVAEQTKRLNYILQTELGQAMIEKQMYTEAVVHLRTVVKKHSKYKPAWKALIRIYEETKNNYELKVVYLDLIKAFGDIPFAITALCQLYSQDGFIEQAVTYCTQAIQKDANVAESHLSLGNSLIDSGERTQGQMIVQKAADRFIASEGTQFRAGELSHEIKNHAGAIRYFSNCVKSDKKSHRCYLGLGKSYYEMAKYKESLDNFVFACKLKPNDLQDFRTASKSLRNQGNSAWSAKFEQGMGTCQLNTDRSSLE